MDVTEENWLKICVFLFVPNGHHLYFEQCYNICVAQLLRGNERVWFFFFWLVFFAVATKPSIAPRQRMGCLGIISMNETLKYCFDSFGPNVNIAHTSPHTQHLSNTCLDQTSGSRSRNVDRATITTLSYHE